jgi:hypothetical protein
VEGGLLQEAPLALARCKLEAVRLQSLRLT